MGGRANYTGSGLRCEPACHFQAWSGAPETGMPHELGTAPATDSGVRRRQRAARKRREGVGGGSARGVGRDSADGVTPARRAAPPGTTASEYGNAGASMGGARGVLCQPRVTCISRAAVRGSVSEWLPNVCGRHGQSPLLPPSRARTRFPTSRYYFYPRQPSCAAAPPFPQTRPEANIRDGKSTSNLGILRPICPTTGHPSRARHVFVLQPAAGLPRPSQHLGRQVQRLRGRRPIIAVPSPPAVALTILDRCTITRNPVPTSPSSHSRPIFAGRPPANPSGHWQGIVAIRTPTCEAGPMTRHDVLRLYNFTPREKAMAFSGFSGYGPDRIWDSCD